ncbi:hypothetical protein Taro_054819 [Colocasia esculenta]|uniref:Uncharacterized protein n=1 Tax=Colocasia esculenta TaxID=4460 RepID=A0A843XPP6_COLES|nr:hypothetical protein [Colocasia esculenta]
MVWQPYLEEGDEGQPQLVQARPYFGRPGRSFRGLHDTTDWHVRAQEQINNWEHRGKAFKSAATTDDAYLQAYALKYGGKVYKSARHQRKELDRVRSAAAGGASSSRGEESHQRELTDQLVAVVLRAEEAERDLVDRVRELRTATDRALELQGQMDSVQSERGRLQGEMETVRGERDQLRIRAKAAEARAEEATRELEALRLHGPSGGQKEIARLRSELQIQQGIARGRSRSRSGASASRHTGASVGQYLAGSSSRRRNEEEERCRRGKASAQSAGGGGGMLPPPDRQEGLGESGGSQ